MSKFSPEDYVNHRYQVKRLLGRGAMGEVYLAEDMIKIHRQVALKVLQAENLEEADYWSRGEYEALTRLHHPNLANVYDFARIQKSDDFYIVSEFIRGEDLMTATRESDTEEWLDILAQTCRALEYIHTQGYVHFDIKPDNILVTRVKEIGSDDSSKVQWDPRQAVGSERGSGPPRVKLIDFGLAERVTGTFNFAIKGTFHYVAPEIIAGKAPDKRADLYSLGVTCYAIMADGKLPFVDESGNAVDRGRTPWREDVKRDLVKWPEWLVDIVVRLLEEDPQKRYPSARSIIQALNAGSGRHYELETAETQVSYLYSARLIGRRKELNSLRDEADRVFTPCEELRESSSGDTSVVSRLLKDGASRQPLIVISGEIGVGKTRIVDEFQHILRMREIAIHTGNCYESVHDAYLPFREIIEQLAIGIGLQSDIYQRYAAMICRLCPNLRARTPDAKEVPGFRPDKERLYFIDGLANFIIEASTHTPCVINVNNLHWADESTVELLSHVVNRIVATESNLPTLVPILILATMRTDETMAEAQRTILGTLRDENYSRELCIRRFSRTQIAELIHGMLHLEEIPAPFIDRLEERTSGNPLFIVETLKVLQEEGIIAREGDAWCIRGSGDLSKIEIPHGIESILLRRVRALEAGQQRILEAISAYDKAMSPRLLECFEEFKSINVLSSLRELENRGMVVKSLDGGRLQFAIAQAKMREILYNSLADERLRSLHRELAESILALNSENPDAVIEDLAHHFQRSDCVEKSLEFTIRAGDDCRKLFAHDRCVEHYRHVIRQTEGVDAYRRVWFETYEKIGDAGALSADYSLAESSYAMLLHVDVDDLIDFTDRARILRKAGKVDEIRGEYECALRLYKEARDLFDPDADLSVEQQTELIRVYNAIGWVYVCMGKYDRAMKISIDALRMIEGVDERSEHAMIFSTIGSSNYYKGNLEQAIEFHSRALEIYENSENIPSLIVSLNNLGDAHLSSSEYMTALRYYEQALEASEKVGDIFGRAMALHNLSKLYLALGHLGRSEALLSESLALSRDFKMRYLTTINFLLRGRIRMKSEEFGKAESDLFRALGVFAKQGTLWGLARCLMEIADLQSQRGNYEEATRLIEEAVQNSTTLSGATLQGQLKLLQLRIRHAAAQVSDEEMLEQLTVLSRSIEGPGTAELFAQVLIEQGEIMVKRRELEEAKQLFGRADEIFREIGDRLPPDHRESYLRQFHISAATTESEGNYREIASAEETAIQSASERPTEIVESSRTPGDHDEMLRIATLLQEVGQAVSPGVFLQKVMNCVIQAVKADEGFLLVREGEKVRVLIAVNDSGDKVKKAGSRICVEALEDVWESDRPILATRILDDARVQSYESLYQENIESLAVLPLRLDVQTRGAVYLNNPEAKHLIAPLGSPVLMAYQNLLQLTTPRPTMA